MIKFELIRNQNILIITPEGPLEKADFEQLAKKMDPLIASKGRLTGLMIYTKSFPGWRNFAAFVSHLRFVVDHHRWIERIAAATNSKLVRIMVPVAGLFVHPKCKHFDFAEK